MEDRAIFNFSRISAFKECPRKYKYSYIDKIPPDFTSIERYVGSVVHETLNWLYSQHQQGFMPDISTNPKGRVLRACPWVSTEQSQGTLEYMKRLNPKQMHACHCTDLNSKIALSKVVNLKEVGVGLGLE